MSTQDVMKTLLHAAWLALAIAFLSSVESYMSTDHLKDHIIQLKELSQDRLSMNQSLSNNIREINRKYNACMSERLEVTVKPKPAVMYSVPVTRSKQLVANVRIVATQPR